MRSRRYLLHAMFIGNLWCVAIAHATTELKQQWMNPGYDAAPLQDMVVMALIRFPIIQHIIEDDVATRFRARDVAALPIYRLAQDDDTAAGESNTRQLLLRSGASVVLVIRVVDPKRAGAADSSMDPAKNGFYDWIAGELMLPSDYRQFTSEARLFDVKNNRWIWTGTFETRDVGRNASKTSQECTDELMRALEHHGLLKPASINKKSNNRDDHAWVQGKN